MYRAERKTVSLSPGAGHFELEPLSRQPFVCLVPAWSFAHWAWVTGWDTRTAPPVAVCAARVCVTQSLWQRVPKATQHPHIHMEKQAATLEVPHNAHLVSSEKMNTHTHTLLSHPFRASVTPWVDLSYLEGHSFAVNGGSTEWHARARTHSHTHTRPISQIFARANPFALRFPPPRRSWIIAAVQQTRTQSNENKSL